MKSHKILPVVTCGLALAVLPAFAKDDHDTGNKFKKIDSDADGRISLAEFTAAKQQKIQSMDADKDGVVTPGEATAGKADKQKKHWWSSEKSTGTTTVNKADTNNDGQVTATEASVYAQKLFAELDTNRDEFLSESELAAGRK